jgi:hypothetical protein
MKDEELIHWLIGSLIHRSWFLIDLNEPMNQWINSSSSFIPGFLRAFRRLALETQPTAPPLDPTAPRQLRHAPPARALQQFLHRLYVHEFHPSQAAAPPRDPLPQRAPPHRPRCRQ